MNENLSGLSAREVEERRARGEGGTGAAKITKTKPQIVRENLCTLFNFLNFLIAVLLFLVGAYSNMLFIAIIILNIVIGKVKSDLFYRHVDNEGRAMEPRILESVLKCFLP